MIYQKAFKKKFADNILLKIITYNSSIANKKFSFINIEFYSFLYKSKNSNFIFYSKNLYINIILLFEKYLYFYPLILNINGIFL